VAALLLGIIALGLASGQTVTISEPVTPFTLPRWQGAVQFTYDGLATVLAAALLLALAFGEIPQPFSRTRSAMTLGVVGLGVAACAAGNLLTLALLWGAIDLYGPFLMRHAAPAQAARRSARFSFTGLASTVALLVALWLQMAATGQARLESATLLPAAVPWLALATVLRLSPWPVQGNYASWEGGLLSLLAGGALWLRLAPALARAGLPLLAPFGIIMLFIASWLTAAATPSSWSYVNLSGVAMMLLAPLCYPQYGTSVSLAVLVTLIWAGALLRLDPVIAPLLPDRWSRLPLAIALGALAGAPPTLGMVAHWRLLALVSRLGSRSLLLTALSLLFVALGLWRRWLQAERPAAPHDRPWGLDESLALGGGALLTLGLVFLGLFPQVLSTDAVTVPALATTLSGSRSAWWFLGAVVLPLALGYPLARALMAPRSLWRGGLAFMGTVFELDWLYVGVEGGLSRLGQWIGRGLQELEGPLALSWTLLWSLTLMLLLMEG
jgi:hypothetical protein